MTVQIDRLCSEQYEEDDFGGIIDLVEVIRIQQSGPTEAARALRKKLCVFPSSPTHAWCTADLAAENTAIATNRSERSTSSTA